jgi:D-aminopeptidase
VLVQSNYGGLLTIAGVPVWKELGQRPYGGLLEPGTGSCMMVVATGAPLDARQLKRLARRALAGMARTGASFSHGSGDYVIAFSTAESVRIPYKATAQERAAVTVFESQLNPLFDAVAEATEEAIYNSLLRATTVRGHNAHEAQALPLNQLRTILKKYGRMD